MADCTVPDCNSRPVVTLWVKVVGFARENTFDYCGIHVGEYHRKFRDSELFLVEVRDIS